jgi:hypothetical protein
MRKFIIERELPAIGSAERQALREAAEKSNATLNELGPDIQWGGKLRRQRPDILRLSGARRGAHTRARHAQRLPGEQDHRSSPDDRPDDRYGVILTRRPRESGGPGLKVGGRPLDARFRRQDERR